jgi:hypothetical protein
MLAGRYRLEERLSERDGSSIWKATDESLARTVTVYTFPAGFRRAGAAIAAARAAARLSDPRLVQIFDADDHGTDRYIVTEWPSGERLDEIIAAGPLDSRLAAEILEQVAGAVAAAHAAGLAHLCLTPDLVWRNRWGEVKVSGLATAAALAGAKDDNPALADTRGLARLLYAALTGCWPGSEQTGLPAAASSGGRLGSPGRLRSDISGDIDAVTSRALFGEDNSYGPPILSPAGLTVALAAIAHPSPDTQPLSSLAASTQPFAPVPPRTQPLPAIPAPAAPPLPAASTQPDLASPAAAAPAAADPASAQPDSQAFAESTEPPPASPADQAPAERAGLAPEPALPADLAAAGSADTPPDGLPTATQALAEPAGLIPAEPRPAAPLPSDRVQPAAGDPVPVADAAGVFAPGNETPAASAATRAVAALRLRTGPLAARSLAAARAGRGAAARLPDRLPRLPELPAQVAGPLRKVLLVLVLVGSLVTGWAVGHEMSQSSGTASSASAAPAHHAGPPARTLRPAGAVTFDPYGDGQNSQLARLAIDASPTTAWHTAWYTTAKFGNLKPGTGLLIDMGRSLTITAARLTLGKATGADLQLRVGSATSLARLRPVAYATGAGGQVHLRLAQPAHGRYVLIWFTKLPRDASGTFEASVYNVRLQGSK